MREIKFRAWHAGHKHAAPQMLYDEKPGDCLVWQSQGQNITQVMQYTGLKDKNGREIYEGDLLKDAAGIGEVEWVQEHCAFMIFTREPSFYYHLECDGQLKVSEVVGNIYENPELLEV